MIDRELIDTIFCAGLAAVDPLATLPPHLLQVKEVLRTGGFERLVVAGFGKAAVPMALAVEEMLDTEIQTGLVIAPHGANLTTLPRRIKVATAGHPHPDPAGVVASRRIIELAHGADDKTLILLLISGGGSALFTAPADEITLEEKMETCRLLMEAGANIQELNTVRKHLSRVKGGKLAALAHPARIFALTVSDVPGDAPDVIASGPAYPDPTTFADALGVLGRLGLNGRVPPAVRKRLELGDSGSIKETPKPGDPVFSSVTTVIAARNRDAMEAAARAARQHDMQVHLVESTICGEAREAGRRLAELAVTVKRKLAPGQQACLISGGETTVRVVGKGKGGRNQEVALAFAMAIEGEPGITFLSGGTDGIDGPTDAAGGVVDGNTIALAKAAGLDPAAYLAENDVYALLERCGGLLKTGPTGTNVMDLQIAVLTG